MRRKITRSGNATRLWGGGGVFLISCKNASDSGGGGGGGGSGSDSRGLSSSNILDHSNVTIKNGDTLKRVLKREGFLGDDEKFTNTPPNTNPNPDPNIKETFQGVLLIKRTDGTTKYVKANESSGKYSLGEDPEIEEGVQVVAVYSDKTIKPIKIEIESGKTIEVPVSVSNGANPTLQDVQNALTKYGIKPDLIGSVPNTPKCPDASYAYQGVTKGNGTTALNSTDTITESDTLKPVFQKEVISQVDIGTGGTVPVQKTATYGDAASQKITVENLLNAANNGSLPSPTDPNGKTLDGWYVTKPGSTQPEHVPSNAISTTEIPLGSSVKPSFVDPNTKNISLTIPNPGDPSGNISIPFTVDANTDENTFSTTWGEIKNKGGTGITNPTAPAGYTFKEWQKNGAPVTDGTTVSKADASTINPVFIKNVNFYIKEDNGTGILTVPIVVTYPNAERTLAGVLTAAGKNPVPTKRGNIFKGWKVDNTVISGTNGIATNTSKTYPENTTFTATWDSAAGSSARDLSFKDNRQSDPNAKAVVGDVVYEENDKGFIVGTEAAAAGKNIMGYIYNVEPDGTVHVVSNNMNNAERWAATTNGAVYTGKAPSGQSQISLSAAVAGAENGFVAWKKIAEWNTAALFANYNAIAKAIVDKKGGTIPTGQATSKEVTDLMDGNTPKDRWYLPTVAELKRLYDNKSKLSADMQRKLTGEFWSCELPTGGGNNENKARYFSFDTGTAGEDDKYSKQINVIAVTEYNVN